MSYYVFKHTDTSLLQQFEDKDKKGHIDKCYAIAFKNNNN